MDLNVYIQLIFLCVVNIIFAFSGLILNKLVIVSFFEIFTNSKEIMPFHDHGVVVFRFGRSHNESPWINAFYYCLVKGGL